MGRKHIGGSQASDNVMSGIHPMWPIFHTGGNSGKQKGGSQSTVSSCTSVPTDIVNNYTNLSSSTVPLAMPSLVPGGVNYAAVPASTMNLMNQHLTNFNVLPNTFSYSIGTFSPPLMVGGCATCGLCNKNKKAMPKDKDKDKKTKAKSTKDTKGLK
jgi:hypothetical protein